MGNRIQKDLPFSLILPANYLLPRGFIVDESTISQKKTSIEQTDNDYIMRVDGQPVIFTAYNGLAVPLTLAAKKAQKMVFNRGEDSAPLEKMVTKEDNNRILGLTGKKLADSKEDNYKAGIILGLDGKPMKGSDEKNPAGTTYNALKVVAPIGLALFLANCSHSTPPDPDKYVDLLQTFNGNVSGGVDYQFDSASHAGSIGQQLNLGQTLENQAKSATIVVTPVGFPKRVYQGVSIYGTQTRSGVFEEINIPLWLQELGSGNPTWNNNKIVLVWETRNLNGKDYDIPSNFRLGFRNWATSYCSGNPLVSTFTEREGNDDPSVTAPLGEIRIFPDNVIAGIVNVSYANGGGVGSGRLLVNYLFGSASYGMIDGEMYDLFAGTANQKGGSIPMFNLKHGARIWAENWQGFEMRSDGEYLNGYPGSVQSGNLSYVQVNYIPGSPSMIPGMEGEYEAAPGARWKGGRTPNLEAPIERREKEPRGNEEKR